MLSGARFPVLAAAGHPLEGWRPIHELPIDGRSCRGMPCWGYFLLSRLASRGPSSRSGLLRCVTATQDTFLSGGAMNSLERAAIPGARLSPVPGFGRSAGILRLYVCRQQLLFQLVALNGRLRRHGIRRFRGIATTAIECRGTESARRLLQ